MSIEENKRIARKWIEAVNQQNYAAFDELMTPGIAESNKQGIQAAYVIWEGHHVEIIDSIAEGDWVYLNCINSATHTGEAYGLPPTGRHWSAKVIFFFRIENGKIMEWDNLADGTDIVKQLGATITPLAPQ